MSEIKKPVVEIINSSNSEVNSLENQSEFPPKKVSEYTKSFHKLASFPSHNREEDQEHTDWFALARKLRQDNRQIIKTLLEREEELATLKEELQAKIIKLENTEITHNQKLAELNSTNEQIKNLSQELKENQKIIKIKEEENTQLASNLIETKQQVAYLERQCSNLQDNYQKEQEKNSILLEKLQELELRLQREQRHHLQFKAALDQCLEKPEEVYPLNIKTEKEKSEPIISAQSPIPKTPGIKPWSDDRETIDLLPENNSEKANVHQQEKPSLTENLIPQLKILNEQLKPQVKTINAPPSPLINNKNSRKNAPEKRPIMLPQFPKLKLNNEG